MSKEFALLTQIKQSISTVPPASSVIKSVQRGSWTYSSATNMTSVVITAVNLSKSFINVTNKPALSYNSTDLGTLNGSGAYAKLNTSTTVIMESGTVQPNVVSSGTLYWEVIEYV